MENDKRILTKLYAFLKREMSITLVFWFVVFFIAIMMRIFGLV